MQIKTFSEKQILTLTWWRKESKYKDYDAIICDGAIRSGKTVSMGISFVLWAFYRFSGSAFAICGKTVRSLKRNVITPILPLLDSMGFKCRYKISENVIQIQYGNISNIFYLFGGKDEASASLIQGITLSGVFFDEVALMPRSFVDQALARCSVLESKFWFNCNPEYPGHWFYKEWILLAERKNAFYVHFTMKDNPSLNKKMIRRYENIYSGTFYRRFVLGQWVASEGLIYPYMCDEEAFVAVPKVEFSRYVVSCDYGIVNPTSCGLWGEYKGIWYRIREYYYDSKTEGACRTDEEHFNALEKMIDGKYIEKIVVDPSASSFITLIRRRGGYKVFPAKNNVVNGIREVSTALKRGDIKICNTCKDSIREFSLYRWGKGGSKDIPIKENDHAMDDIRYFVSTVLTADDEEFFAIAAQR